MHELHDDGAFSHTGGHALDGTMAYVTNHKNSGHVGFEQSGITIECPGRRPLPVAKKVRARKNEATVIALNRIAKPFRSRLRADKNEQA